MIPIFLSNILKTLSERFMPLLVIQVLATSVTLWLADKSGRRLLLIVSLSFLYTFSNIWLSAWRISVTITKFLIAGLFSWNDFYSLNCCNRILYTSNNLYNRENTHFCPCDIQFFFNFLLEKYDFIKFHSYEFFFFKFHP